MSSLDADADAAAASSDVSSLLPSDGVLSPVESLCDGGDDLSRLGLVGAVEDVGEELRGQGAEVVARDEGQVVVVRGAAAARRNLAENRLREFNV